ncbi:hypothetical protein ACFPAF_01760 [Hymenobacter endophyticus]|uniref:2-Component system ADP-ribosyltransferase domain-containing protein n=1 Tax=Hymenobacter endophyticus TaxID=3076335 RepID=A0ABU3TCN3_9BACT|nr:hypothetical protein [Hymenobacter endophyticus]MDU0369104.1 hypothetical protein [Hymenobacter endophyticus]
MPKSSTYPFSKANPVQAEIHNLCKERGIDVLNHKGKSRTNADLIKAIRQYEQDILVKANNPADLFLQTNIVADTSLELNQSNKTEEQSSPIFVSHDPDDKLDDRPVYFSSGAEIELSASDTAGNSIKDESEGKSKSSNKYFTENSITNKGKNYSHSNPKLEINSKDQDISDSLLERDSNIFYLQMQSVNLGTYLSHGVIYPFELELDQEYQSVRPRDLLTQHRSYLPLLGGRLANFTEKDVLIEILLLPNEISRLKIVGSLYCFSEIIPISRIKRILFTSVEAISEFRVNAEQFKNYFFPKNLVGVVDNDLKIITTADTTAAVSESDPVLIHQLRQFDRQLGMFGYLKHAPLLRANTEQYIQDFPTEFLIGLHEINTAVHTEDGNAWVMNTLLRRGPQKATSAGQKLFTAIVQAIYQDEEASYDWGIKLLQRIESLCHQQPEPPRDLAQLQVALAQLKHLEQGQTNFSKALTAIASSDGTKRDIPPLPFTALVLLCNKPGRARSSEDKQAVLINLAQYTNRGLFNAPMLLEQLLAVLGLYYGYAQFTRQDPNLKIELSELNDAAKPLHRLRFDIGLPSDRVVIESVFRYCIEGHSIHDRLTYLEVDDLLVSDQLVLPQRAFHAPSLKTIRYTTTNQKVDQASKVIREYNSSSTRDLEQNSIPTLPLKVHVPSAVDSAILESIIVKMTRWFSPAHFEQQLLSAFTPEEQEALRLVIESRKAR